MNPSSQRREEVLEALRRLAAQGGTQAAAAVGKFLGRPTLADEVRFLRGPTRRASSGWWDGPTRNSWPSPSSFRSRWAAGSSCSSPPRRRS